MLLKDGRIGGTIDNFFIILNHVNFSIQLEIIFNSQILEYMKMKDGLLIIYCQNTLVVNIIKIRKTGYEISYIHLYH